MQTKCCAGVFYESRPFQGNPLFGKYAQFLYLQHLDTSISLLLSHARLVSCHHIFPLIFLYGGVSLIVFKAPEPSAVENSGA